MKVRLEHTFCIFYSSYGKKPSMYLRREMSSCSTCWVVGWRTHFPLSISTRMSNSKSMFLSVVGPLKPRLAGVLGQRSLNSWLTAENPEDFLWDAWLRRKYAIYIYLSYEKCLTLVSKADIKLDVLKKKKLFKVTKQTREWESKAVSCSVTTTSVHHDQAFSLISNVEHNLYI